jgi:hypothetical protein
LSGAALKAHTSCKTGVLQVHATYRFRQVDMFRSDKNRRYFMNRSSTWCRKAVVLSAQFAKRKGAHGGWTRSCSCHQELVAVGSKLEARGATICMGELAKAFGMPAPLNWTRPRCSLCKVAAAVVSLARNPLIQLSLVISSSIRFFTFLILPRQSTLTTLYSNHQPLHT